MPGLEEMPPLFKGQVWNAGKEIKPRLLNEEIRLIRASGFKKIFGHHEFLDG